MSEPVLVKNYNIVKYELCDASEYHRHMDESDSLSYVNLNEILRYAGVWSQAASRLSGEETMSGDPGGASGKEASAGGSGGASGKEASAGGSGVDINSSDSDLSDGFRRIINEIISETETSNAFSYKVCYQEVDITWSCGIAELPVRMYGSKDLSTCLKGCRKAILMAATVGLGVDRLINKYERLSPSKALFLQALGAERVEALCDRFCRELPGTLRPRFSPGYGDLPLEVQKEFIAYLDCTRLIGITLNDSLLMTPSKSVTAIVGIEPEDIPDPAAICDKGMRMIKQGVAREGIAEIERALSLGYGRAALYLGDIYAKNGGPEGSRGGNFLVMPVGSQNNTAPGHGQDADIMKAYKYYSLAAADGVKEAKQRISYILPSVDSVGHNVLKWFDDPVGSIQEQMDQAKKKRK